LFQIETIPLRENSTAEEKSWDLLQRERINFTPDERRKGK
jgi:hypothetical protein